MIYYDRIDVSEGIDVKKTSALKEYNICYYLYFLDKGVKFQLYVWNWYHDVSMMPIKSKYLGILNICGIDYYCVINRIAKSITIN